MIESTPRPASTAEVVDELRKRDIFVMVSHVKPDGDTLGVGATGALLLNPNLPSNPGPDLLRELAPVAKLIDVA